MLKGVKIGWSLETALKPSSSLKHPMSSQQEACVGVTGFEQPPNVAPHFSGNCLSNIFIYSNYRVGKSQSREFRQSAYGSLTSFS